MQVHNIVKAYQSRNAPLGLLVAMVRESVGLYIQPTLAGIRADKSILVCRGGRQGGKGIPWAWKSMLSVGVAKLIEKWRNESKGLKIWDCFCEFTLVVWADHLHVFAHSLNHLQDQIYDVIEWLDSLKLTAKPSSLQVLMNKHAKPKGEPQTLRTRNLGTSDTFQLVDKLLVLGIMVDDVGSSACAFEQRLAAGQALWHANRRWLYNQKVLLAKRMFKFYFTIARSILWGSGGWTLSKRLATDIDRFDNYCLRSMCKIRRKMNENWVQFIRRSIAFARDFCQKCLLRGSLDQCSASHHRWLGHLARCGSASSLASIALGWLDSRWWSMYKEAGTQLDVTNQFKWRHPTKNWQKHIECDLDLFYGVEWREGPLNRRLWKSGERAFVESCRLQYACSATFHTVAAELNMDLTVHLLDNDGSRHSGSDLHSVEARPCKYDLKSQLIARCKERGHCLPPLAIHGDNQSVVLQVKGVWKSSAKSCMIAFCQSVIHSLVAKLGVKAYDHQFLYHIPRKFNRRADALAYYALNRQELHSWCRDGLQRMFDVLAGKGPPTNFIQVYFDRGVSEI